MSAPPPIVLTAPAPWPPVAGDDAGAGGAGRSPGPVPCRIICGDARDVMRQMPAASVDLSFWSPPYFVGKSYERDLDFDGWRSMVADVVGQHARVVKPGGFMVVNIADILCFVDHEMPRIQADSVSRKRVPVTREDVEGALRDRPGATRHELAAILGCSEQTVQRRLEHNNVRGGKPIPGTRVLQTSAMVAEWASEAGLYLYDKRVWHKDPAWMSCRWHTVSYRAVDEYEHVLVFWNPGITEYDRGRLTASEWREWGSRGVWNIRSVARNSRHEAEFPEELARRVVRLFSPPGGTVLDPFVGTGTTTAVAAMEGRRWVGIERNRRHADMASARTRSLLPGAPPSGGGEPGRPPCRPE